MKVMALKQVPPNFTLGSIKDTLEPVPRTRAPHTVEFRLGADLKPIVSAIMAHRSVRVDAAPGAGKSRLLPQALARVSGALVVHAFPFIHMADEQYRRMGSDVGVRMHLVTETSTPWPASGWVFTSAAVVVARWLESGLDAMPECYVLHDESHESGWASAVLRILGPVVDAVKSYVSMTATRGADGARRTELEGKLTDMEYAPGAFAQPWSVEESGAPWACDALEGNILIFEDDKQRAAELVQAYNLNGVRAYRMHSGMTLDAFHHVMDEMAGGGTRLMALIADSTFRSGYTMRVSTIVDSGLVKRVVVVDGKPTWSQRAIYEGERVQSRARGGRLRGQNTTYWRPQGDLEKKICDLEQTDVEAAALVLRLLGYRPSGYMDAVMASGRVPLDVPAALRGFLPLACLRPEQLCEFSQLPVKGTVELPAGGRVAPEVAMGGSSAPKARFEGFGALHHEGMGILQGAMATGRGHDDESTWRTYMLAVGLTDVAAGMVYFPSGYASVAGLVNRDRMMEYVTWPVPVRSAAVSVLVAEHNRTLVEWMATTLMLQQAKANIAGREQGAVARWAETVSARYAELSLRLTSTHGMAQRLARDFCSLYSVEGGFASEEHELAACMYDHFLRLPGIGEAMGEAEARALRDYVPEAARRITHSHAGGGEGSGRGPDGASGFIKWAGGERYRRRSSVGRIRGSSHSSSSGST